MTILETLRHRWGGGIRPELSIDRNGITERWDGEGEGPATSITFEGFGITIWLNIGWTPARTGEPAIHRLRFADVSACLLTAAIVGLAISL